MILLETELIITYEHIVEILWELMSTITCFVNNAFRLKHKKIRNFQNQGEKYDACS